MMRRSTLLYVAVALPPLVLAAIGITHPMHLTDASAEYWRNLHIAILPIFPLLGFAPWLIVRGSSAAVRWIEGVLGFVYAIFYTALDVLAGIGSGGLRLDGMGMAVGTLYRLADHLGLVGSIALVLACVVATAVAVVRSGIMALPGGILVIFGSVLFLNDHIYAPGGVVGQLCLAIGWGAMLFAAARSNRRMSSAAGPASSAVA